ncbi:hypothetical protein PGT21_006322 [Puccinia graminis f. sp. tritici]|uniref:Uncharacterized protein n=1 Tax=Puccinia graminis f. sp. tritici TaxID=56615 RepID=A0A5B0M5W0_PUCGR|nr:hypothetical protein PGT21_006322 [Puccinia graminis f. sp. tritici]KAA1123126.1 hypothetical protein PGTUg99_011965 [Puccinia graminis f. sp. tritici]
MKFFSVFIAIMLGGLTVEALDRSNTDPAFAPSDFPCVDKSQPQAVCLGTVVKKAKDRTIYYLHSADNAPKDTFSCNELRNRFGGGFHNTCCSKDLDLSKFPQTIPQTEKKVTFAKLDPKTFDKFCKDLTPS